MTKCDHLYNFGRCQIYNAKERRYCRACGGRLKDDPTKVGRPSSYCPPPKKCRRLGSTIIQRRFKRRLQAQELHLARVNTTH